MVGRGFSTCAPLDVSQGLPETDLVQAGLEVGIDSLLSRLSGVEGQPGDSEERQRLEM